MKSLLRESQTTHGQKETPAYTTTTTKGPTTTLTGETRYQTGQQLHPPTTADVQVERVERPMVVRETVLPEERVEIQPVIHREREKLEVHEVYQPLKERDIAPTEVRHINLPSEMRPEQRSSDVEFQERYRELSSRYVPGVEVQPVKREVVNRAPIVEEVVKRKIVEEVQPVLYRETVKPVLIQETQPIYEKIIEKPVIVEETRQTVDLGQQYIQQTYAPSTQTYAYQTYAQPGTQTYAQPGTQTYDQPSTQTYDQPGTQTYAQPGTQTYAQPGTQTYAQPSTQTYAQPSTQTYAQHGYTQASYQTTPLSTQMGGLSLGGEKPLHHEGYIKKEVIIEPLQKSGSQEYTETKRVV